LTPPVTGHDPGVSNDGWEKKFKWIVIAAYGPLEDDLLAKVGEMP
jgi:hypothetical protein